MLVVDLRVTLAKSYVHPLRVNNKAIVMGAHDRTEYHVNVLNMYN